MGLRKLKSFTTLVGLCRIFYIDFFDLLANHFHLLVFLSQSSIHLAGPTASLVFCDPFIHQKAETVLYFHHWDGDFFLEKAKMGDGLYSVLGSSYPLLLKTENDSLAVTSLAGKRRGKVL